MILGDRIIYNEGYTNNVLKSRSRVTIGAFHKGVEAHHQGPTDYGYFIYFPVTEPNAVKGCFILAVSYTGSAFYVYSTWESNSWKSIAFT